MAQAQGSSIQLQRELARISCAQESCRWRTALQPQVLITSRVTSSTKGMTPWKTMPSGRPRFGTALITVTITHVPMFQEISGLSSSKNVRMKLGSVMVHALTLEVTNAQASSAKHWPTRRATCAGLQHCSEHLLPS